MRQHQHTNQSYLNIQAEPACIFLIVIKVKLSKHTVMQNPPWWAGSFHSQGSPPWWSSLSEKQEDQKRDTKAANRWQVVMLPLIVGWLLKGNEQQHRVSSSSQVCVEILQRQKRQTPVVDTQSPNYVVWSIRNDDDIFSFLQKKSKFYLQDVVEYITFYVVLLFVFPMIR